MFTIVQINIQVKKNNLRNRKDDVKNVNDVIPNHFIVDNLTVEYSYFSS